MLMCAANASASNAGFYIAVTAGKGFVQEFNPDEAYNVHTQKALAKLILGAKVGYRINPALRVDINAQARPISYKGTDLDGGEFRQKIYNYSMFVNAYLDIPSLGMVDQFGFTPYLTAGLGYTRNQAKTLSVANDLYPPDELPLKHIPGMNTGGFAWNIGCGIIISPDHNLDLDISYRYYVLGVIKTGPYANHPYEPIPPSTQHIKAHEVSIALVLKL
jgi:opacity protein-like surface antigen